MRKPTPLKVAIFTAGLRQKDIAEALEMDEGHLSRIVNGLHCSDDLKNAIADEIGRPIDELWPTDEQLAA